MTAERRGEWRRVKEVFQGALALPVEQRHAFLHEACGGDRALHDEVLSLLTSYEQAGEFLEAPALSLPPAATAEVARTDAPDPNIGRLVGSYYIESRIGYGGMGAVYMARRADQAFERRVAIKMIRRGVDSDSLIPRFRHERQILASLEHPNIAGLLDGGTTDDGVPYLVMELVQGSRIDEYCDRHKRSVTERLRLFRQVCEAVQYAHQRLVIHRDLKPANILVQEDGVPKLLDFGIAKLLDPASRGESTILAAMTPAYASPEQVRGEPITTASDVYSLGVVLYQLLTGRSPYPGDTRSSLDLARAVCDTEPGRPSTIVSRGTPRRDGEAKPVLTAEELSKTREGSPLKLRRRLAGDLDHIVLKALRKEPDQRYQSVEQFSEDIRRHLERLPISARKGSWRYRAGKFAARHRIAVAAAALVLLAIVTGTIATARQARIASLQAEIARTERARAEKRFNDVRKLANSVVFELHDSIEDLPGATAARKLLVERALEYLDSLAAESRDDPTLQRELADGYKRIGDIQGGPYTANVGNTPLALSSYERALSIRQALLSSRPADVENAIGFAEVSRLMADALKASGNASAALAHVQRAVQTLQTARTTNPENTRLLQELMRAYGAEASLHASFLVNTSLGDLAAALPLRRKQLEIAERLYGTAPVDEEGMRALASALSAMGDQLLMMGERRAASEHFVRAQQHLLKLAGLSTSRTALFALHDSYYRLLPVRIAEGDLELARATAQRASDIAQKLVAGDAHNAQARLVLAADMANFGEVLSRLGKHSEARAALADAMRIDAELVREFPNTAQFRSIRQQRFLIGGDMYSRSGRYAQALRFYADARDILQRMMTADPKNEGARLRLAFAHKGMGFAFLRMNDLDAAGRAFEEAITLMSKALDSGTLSENAKYAVADAYAGLGEMELARAAATAASGPARAAHLRQALDWTDRSLQVWQRVKEPGLVSPDGYACTPLEEVRTRRAQIAAALGGVEATLRTPR